MLIAAVECCGNSTNFEMLMSLRPVHKLKRLPTFIQISQTTQDGKAKFCTPQVTKTKTKRNE